MSNDARSGADPVARITASAVTSQPVAATFSAADVGRMIDRMSHQILEKTSGATDVVLMGIPTGGVPLAHRLASRIASFEPVEVGVGALDTTLYRDDLRLRGVRPLAETIEPAGGIDGKLVILVDDVLYSGRTIRAALDALRDLGRPRAVQLAVLVDRGHRELPIRADYVGKNLPTAPGEKVRVLLAETDSVDEVHIVTSDQVLTPDHTAASDRGAGSESGTTPSKQPADSGAAALSAQEQR